MTFPVRVETVAFRLILFFCFTPIAAMGQARSLITLDEFMNTTQILDAAISPDGAACVVSTEAPDWEHNRFRKDLWLWRRDGGLLLPLTQSGHDTDPRWSPDGRYIAFISDRPVDRAPNETSSEDATDDGKKENPGRVWIIPSAGGEAFPLYQQKADVHAFAWSKDGKSILFSATEPVNQKQQESEKAEWKDVIRWREQERGDVLLSLPVETAVQATTIIPAAHETPETRVDDAGLPVGSRLIVRSSREIAEIAISPSGSQIAFETGSISHRLENPADAEVFLVPTAGGDARQLTLNNGLESHLRWDRDDRRLYFLVAKGSGSIEGAYQDVQGRLYALDITGGKTTRLGSDFKGSWEDFVFTREGSLLATGLNGVHQSLYRISGDEFESVGLKDGSYEHLHAALDGNGLVFTHSGITKPTQVYLAADVPGIKSARSLTTFNTVFGERAQVEWTPYRWRSDDGMEVEGVLIYPPGLQGRKHLRMLTLIHGGPEDADGDHFGADWYDWATLAAANGWLVFRPNYRGSIGYGDAFMLSISPHLVSAPGRDILDGVDALVKDGIADPEHLTIGGYSYGGYMTNWLITQTTRFKAAVTGAGAVEHAANWGNDDLTFDDAWYLSGTPWERPDLYQSEAALFQMNKVTTPTHIVGGNSDVRVSYFEQILLERALEKLNVPHTLLVFPGENHPLANDPWHGYIKVREELKWLAKYGQN